MEEEVVHCEAVDYVGFMRFCRATLSQDRIKEIKRQCAEQFEKVTNKRREKRKNRDGAAVSA